jgi:putative oxidoreductase
MSICKIKCDTTQKIYNCIKSLDDKIIYLSEKYAAPVLLLAMRFWMANIFFKSGLTKIANIDSTISLFEYEYNLPLVSPTIAAYLSIAAELGCSTFLAAGFLTRLAAIPLIAMSLIIQLLVIQSWEHFYWLFLFSTILVFGGGKISVDNFLKQAAKKVFNNPKPSLFKRLTSILDK